MQSKRKTTKVSENTSSKYDEELNKAIERAEQLEEEYSRPYYILQSNRHEDVFFVSPNDSHPNATLIV